MSKEEDEAAAVWPTVDISDDMAALRKKPRRLGGGLDARGGREEQERGPALDGRRQRYKGRTAQLNVKVRPEFKKELARLAAAHKSTMAEIIEFAVEKYAREVEERNAEAKRGV